MKGNTYNFEAIRKARIGSDKTVEWLAGRAGVSTMQWWRLENGRGASLELIQKASWLLNLDWRAILLEPRIKVA